MGDDFVITAHALDRFEERFPDLWTDDNGAAHLIHEECDAALAEGRASWVAPLELAHNDLDRWEAGKGLVVWTPGKERGYVLLETEEGMLVTTVLQGRERDDARKRLYEGAHQPKREERGT
jgi:hypothetical protein